MSRRFGRNQKRKLRAQVALAESAAAQAVDESRLLRYTNQRLREKLAYIEDAARRLDYTALLPAEAQAFKGDPTQRWRVSPRTPTLEFWPSDVPAFDTPATFQAVDLASLSFAIEERPDEFLTDVHFIAEGSGKFDGKWAYRVSDSVLAHGMPPDIREKFCREIGRKLMKAFDRHIGSTTNSVDVPRKTARG